MKNLLITPDEAKNIAKAMFISYHPDNEMWFDVAWEVLEENELHHKPASNLCLLPGLAATGETSSDMALMADDFAMFFEAFMTKDPVRGTELAEKIQNIAARRSGGVFNRDNMIKRFSSVLETTDNDKFHSVNEMIKEQFAETQELIRSESKETRKQLNTTIVDNKYQTNWKIRIIKDQKKVIINSGREDKTFQFSNLQVDILLALAHYALSENQNQEYMYWEDLITKVPKWKIQKDSSIDDDDIRRHIMNIRNIFADGYSKIIETKRLEGYRISTNPANISVE